MPSLASYGSIAEVGSDRPATVGLARQLWHVPGLRAVTETDIAGGRVILPSGGLFAGRSPPSAPCPGWLAGWRLLSAITAQERPRS